MQAKFKASVSNPITYAECAELCSRNKGADWFKLANNTYVQPSSTCADSYEVKLHSTEIITVHSDGTYTLCTGGYNSITTCDRLNRLGPCPAFIRSGCIYVRNYLDQRYGEVYGTMALIGNERYHFDACGVYLGETSNRRIVARSSFENYCKAD